MRRLMLVLAVATIFAVDTPCWARKPKEEPKQSWFSRWFGGSKKKAPKQMRDEERKAREADLEKVRAERKAAMEARSQEEAEYFRRDEIRLKLMTIALQTQDSELQKKADRIDACLWKSYNGTSEELISTIKSAQSAENALLKKNLGPRDRNEELNALLKTSDKKNTTRTASRGGN